MTRRFIQPLLALLLLLPGLAPAHGFKAGDISIDHPYAMPTPAQARSAAVYFRELGNGGDKPDRLLGARTPLAGRVEIHRSTRDGDVMRMRAIDTLELPAGSRIKLRHGGEVHLMLTDLKQPLVNGDRFPITLRFEHGGEKEVMVWVQQPRDGGPAHRH
jgi:periplasmic copper chaperone A